MNYPNPCDACGKDHCTIYRDCSRYLKRLNTIWKQFNAYPARVYRAKKAMRNEKFVYEHPDAIRRYLEKGPCDGCKRAEDCETPCPAYWRWWDARMEWLRRRLCR